MLFCKGTDLSRLNSTLFFCITNMQFGTVCIVGPGLIGGSIGLGLKARNLVKTVVGVGHRASFARMRAEDARHRYRRAAG